MLASIIHTRLCQDAIPSAHSCYHIQAFDCKSEGNSHGMASLGLDPDRNNMHQSPEEAANQSSFDPEKGSSSNSPTATESGQAGDPKPGGKESVYKGLGWLDRLLALWILLAIIVGILIGNYVDGAEAALQKGKFVQVSVPIGKPTFRSSLMNDSLNAVTAVGLLVMMYPILCKVQYETLHLVFQKRAIWIQLGFSILMNWIVAPFLMLALSWAFLPDESGLREGLILVGLARCIAMVRQTS